MGNYLKSSALLIEAFKKIRDTISPVIEVVNENKQLIIGGIYSVMDFATWTECAKKAAEKGIVLTESIPIELAIKIYDSPDDEIESLIEKHYFENDLTNFKLLITKCKQSDYLTAYACLFNEVLDSFEVGNYQLACIGLFSISDGLLADVSNMVNSTKFKNRIEALTKKISEEDVITNISKSTISVCNFFDASNNYFDVSPFKNSRFSDDEPTNVNRHWAVHGRSRRVYSRLDFLKIILWIDALTILADISKEGTCDKTI